MPHIDPYDLGYLAVDALERIAFIMSEVCDADDLTEPFAASRRARISVSGVADGHVWLESDDGFARELAAGMLGTDPDDIDPATDGELALAELANIIGGSLAVEWGGRDETYRIGLPEPGFAAPEASREATADVNAESGREAGRETGPAVSGTIVAYVAGEIGSLRLSWVPNAAARSAA